MARPDPDSARRPRWGKGESALAGGRLRGFGAHARVGSPGRTCGITGSHEMLPVELCFPALCSCTGWAGKGQKSWCPRLGKLHTSLTRGHGGPCVHLPWDRDNPRSIRGESRHGNTALWGAGWAPGFACASGKHQTQEIRRLGMSLCQRLACGASQI